MNQPKIVYMTESTMGNGEDDPFRTIYHFWERKGDEFVLLYSLDPYTKKIIEG